MFGFKRQRATGNDGPIEHDAAQDARISHDTETTTLAELSKMAAEMGVGGAYERKVALLNRAIKEEIGFGKFQIWLTWLAGFGWFIDNVSGTCAEHALLHA